MPTLQQKGDGDYIVRGFHHDQHSTWQVLGEGVRVLARRGIRDGQWFSTDVFMELLTRRLAYHGGVPPSPAPPILRDTPSIAGLRIRAREFHRLLYAGQAKAALDFVWKSDSFVSTVESFPNDTSVLRSLPWYMTDPVAYELSTASQANLDGATRIGVVQVHFNERGALTAGAPGELKECWLECGRQWRIVWKMMKMEPDRATESVRADAGTTMVQGI